MVSTNEFGMSSGLSAKSSIPAAVIAPSFPFALPLLPAFDALRISGVAVGKQTLHLLQFAGLALVGQAWNRSMGSRCSAGTASQAPGLRSE